MDEIFKWSFVLLSLIGYYLNAKKNKWCFIIWVICSVGWISVSVLNHEWALTANFSMYLCFEIYGFIQWNKDEKKLKKRIKLEERLSSVYTNWADM
jgi:nicotinamide riboside transporter PnuC